MQQDALLQTSPISTSKNYSTIPIYFSLEKTSKSLGDLLYKPRPNIDTLSVWNEKNIKKYCLRFFYRITIALTVYD